MKKIVLLILTTVYFTGCSNDEQENLIDETAKTDLSVTYIYDGEKINVSLIKSSDTVIVVDNDESQRIEKIFEKNPTLIEYSISESESILFKNDVELNNYIESNRIPTQKNNYSSRSANWTNDNLQLYRGKYFNEQFPWINEGRCAVFQNSPDNEASAIERLKYMGTDDLWDYSPQPPSSICTSSADPTKTYVYIVDANDIISSIVVYDLMVRFYEHPNYGGKSFVIDATGGPALAYDNLSTKRLSLFHSWNDKITSIKIY